MATENNQRTPLTYKGGEEVQLGDTVRVRWPTGKGEISKWHVGQVEEIHDNGEVTVNSPKRSLKDVFQDVLKDQAPLRGRGLANELELVSRAPQQEQKLDQSQQQAQRRKQRPKMGP